MTNTIQQLEDLKEWSQDSARYERRLNFRGAGLVQPGPGRQGFADDHLDKANLVRQEDSIKNLNEKWTAEKVKEAAEKIYPDEKLDAILNDIVKRRKINKHLTEYGEGLVESEARIEGSKKRTITLRNRDIADIRKNLVKNNKKVTMVNGKFIFADAKLQEAFVDDMILKYKHPATGRIKMEAGVLNSKQIFKKYFEGTYSEKGVHELMGRFKEALGYAFSKVPPGERNADDVRRMVKLIISQAGKRISGLDKFPAHHLYPIGDEFAHGTQDFAVIDKKTNSQLSGPNKELIHLSEKRTQLVNDVSSTKISVAEFDKASAKLDAQAESIINNHYKKYPKHDGLLNWRKAGLILDDQGLYMDITVKGTVGGDAKKWSLTNIDKSIQDLSREELATFKSDVRSKSFYKVLEASGFPIDQCFLKVKGGTANPDDCIRRVVNEITEKAKQGDQAALKIFKNQKQVLKQTVKRGTGLASKLSWILGPIDIPIEVAFALPHLLMGDFDAAKRATTFGLTGWGEIDLSEVNDPRAKKYLKHVRDTKNYINLWEKYDHYQTKLENLPEDASDALRKETTERVQKAVSGMDTIGKSYQGYRQQPEKIENRKEEWAYNPEKIAGEKATRRYLERKVRMDLEKTLPTTKSNIMGVDIDLSMYPDYDKKIEAQRKEKLDKLRQPPKDLESFIEQKGQDFYGDPEGWFFYKPLVQEEAEAYGVGDIYDNYYMGAGEGKDIRDSYSAIPLEYASQLGALEAKETREGLEAIRERQYSSPLNEMYYARGGIASLKKK